MAKAKRTTAPCDPALLKAVAAGDLKKIQERIAAGADVNAAAKNEEPALFAAVGHGHLAAVQALLAAGADLNRIAYPRGASVKSTPLCYAIERGHWDIAQALLQAGADLALEPYEGKNAAGEAAQQASRDYFTLMASEEDWLGKPRTEAVKQKAQVACDRWMQFVRDAIARGVKVDDYWLWNAVNHRHDELALLLISAGVNPDAAPHGSSALVRAIEHGRDEVALALLKANATVNPQEDEAPPLLVAAQKGRLGVIPALLAAGADINAAGDIALGEFGEPEEEEKTNATGEVTSHTLHFSTPPVAEASTALIIAARLGNAPLLKLLVEKGADVNRGDKHGLTALGWALRLGHQEVASLLRQAGAAEPEFLEGSLNTALWSAARAGDAAKVEQLLNRGANPNEPVEDREGKHFPLVSAAREGRLPVVRLLLNRGADPNAGASENWFAGVTPLMAASRQGHLDVVKALLEAGAQLESKDTGYEQGGETALHYAARGDHADVIEALLAAGAKVNAKAKGGNTPLAIAITESKRNAAKALLAASADPNAGPSDGSGPLYSAAFQSDLELVKLLLGRGAQPAPRGKKPDFLALEAAAEKGAVEIVRLLLQAGAPIDAQGVVGSTALSSAALRGQEDAVKVLLEAGANPNLADRDGFTPLMAALRSGKPTVVELLLRAGADVRAATKDGRTALKIAREDRKQNLISMLEAAAAQQPPAKPAAPKPARAPKPAAEEEKGLEPPVFSEAAKQPAFQAALREVETLCGTKPKRLGDIAGGYSFPVARDLAEKLLADHHQRLLEQGAYLFRHHRDPHDRQDQLGLLPTRDWTDLIRAFQTNGANFDLMPADIARWLQKLHTRQPFLITGVGWDWLEGRFTGPVKDARKLARQMYEFCPDIVDQGIGSVKDLARALEKDRYFFFWWD